MKRLPLIVVILFSSLSLFCQDEIILMNGKILKATIVETDSSEIKYQYSKKDKQKEGTIDIYRVYALKYKDGKEEILYVQDSAAGHKFTIEEMGAFIQGERMAIENHTTPVPLVYGFVLSSAGGYFLPTILAVPVPIIVAFTTLIPRIKVKSDYVDDKELLKKESFMVGYQRVVRSKRLNRALIGGVVGTVGGIVLQNIIPL